jgi:membrane protease YdiL (CAAX protease family)
MVAFGLECADISTVSHSEFALVAIQRRAYPPVMRPFRALVIYIAAVFIGGALLAPWLYWLAQNFSHEFPQAARAPFHRVLDRAFLIVALAGVWPLLRSLGANSWRDLGFVPPYGQSGKFFGGLLLGLFSLAVAAGIAIGAGGRVFVKTATAHEIVGIVLGALVTAAIVGTVEEILFRGGIFGGLRRVLHWPFALGISSVVYALAHFLQGAELAGAVAWNSGLVLLPQLLAGFADIRALLPGFFSLTLAGVLLGLAYQRTGNLYFSIGLHAGWIFTMKIYSQLTVSAPDSRIWLWGGGKMTDGWLAFFAIAAVFAVVRFLPLGEKRSPYVIPP